MNKKLFFAGFALLAAVSFTSCNSDNPIDITNPNGVTPAAATHYVGGEYDWTAIVKNYDDLKKFWAEDGKKVADLLKDNKDNTVDILIDVTGYELKKTDGANGDGYLMIPDFWAANGGTATADGKVVNITFAGNFKNADFERADFIKNGAKATKFPVKINTDNLKGAEVNFIFNVEKFDLDLASSKTRSTLNGDYTIGYLKAKAAETLSATEFKSGTIEGFDNASTGDFKGTIAGVWVSDVTKNNIEATAKGIKVGTNDAYTVYGKNLFLEINTNLDTWYKAGSNDAQYKVGTVQFVAPVVLFLNGTKNSGAADVDAIENIIGFDKAKCMVVTQGIGKDFSKIDAVEKVTVASAASATTILEKDIFTDVNFADPVEFNTGKITAFENVAFDALTIKVDANDKTLNFTGVNFYDEVKMTSTMEIENTVAYTTYKLYQWVVDNTQPKGGYWELYNNNGNAVAGKSIKAYNEGLAIGEYSDTHIVLADGANSVGKGAQGSDAEVTEAETYRLLKITHYNGAGKVTVTPENTKVVLDGACQFWFSGALSKTDAALNESWGNKGAAAPGGTVVPNAQEVAWYSVEYNEIPYKWIASLDKTGAFAKYILVKNQ